MNGKLNDKVNLIKEGKKVSNTEKNENEKYSKKRMIIQYIIPLIILIIVAIIYIPTQINILLIAFAILMFITLWGWDSSSRVCRNCKKWNSVAWIKTERISRKTNVKKKSLLNKNKKKTVEVKITRLTAKCNNCECEYEVEKNRLI